MDDQFSPIPKEQIPTPPQPSAGRRILQALREILETILPALLIATVDKFAQMPWKGETQMLFGETDTSNPFVPVEQMMPFLPFVRCRD